MLTYKKERNLIKKLSIDPKPVRRFFKQELWAIGGK